MSTGSISRDDSYFKKNSVKLIELFSFRFFSIVALNRKDYPFKKNSYLRPIMAL